MKKLLIWLLLVALLVVAASGCGAARKARELQEAAKQLGELAEELEELSGEELEELGGEEWEDLIGESEENGDVESLFNDEVFYPADYIEIINTFQEFGYEWTSVKEDGESSVWSIYYKVAGREEVDGVEALHIMYTHEENNESNDYEFWFDDGWECVKALKNGDEIEIYDASLLTMTVQNYANYVQLTQTVIAEDGTYETFGYSLEGRSSESADLGAGTVKIDLYDILVKLLDFTNTYGLAEIDGKLVYVVVKASSNNNQASEEMRVTYAVPY